MSNVITKTIRLKITVPIHPTNSWKELVTIFKKLHEETRIASNKCITQCNMEYCHNIDEKFPCNDKRRLRRELYNIARDNAPSLQSYNSNSISEKILNLYFGSSQGSYANKIKKGDGNPPMGYSKTIPIPIAGKKYFKFDKKENGLYDFSFSLVSQKFKKEWNEGLSSKNQGECFKMSDGVFKVGISASNPSVKNIVERCISGEYSMCGSEIVNKNNKYYINLTYSFKCEPSLQLNEKNIMGIDIGINNPVYLAVNFNDYSRKVIGGRYIVDNKAKYEEELRRARMDAGIKNKRGHGRKNIVQYPNSIREKSHNYTTTENRRIAKMVTETAKRWNCGTIHMEDLGGIKQNNKNLQNWTYYQLQQFIEESSNQAGIEVEYVEAKYTSQRCSKCGYISKENRPKGDKGMSYFCCKKCGYNVDADFNAARNISLSPPKKDKKNG